MISDRQIRKVIRLMQSNRTMAIAADKAGMSERTARKWIKRGKLPSELKAPHAWRTREDPFEDVWERVKPMLEVEPGLEAKTVFEFLQRQEPGLFADGQLRTLQRRVKYWRATEGPAKEVFFPQVYQPGELCASDFTFMNDLGIRIGSVPFDHLLYHYVLPYSNWETGTICFSESFESLSEGLQNALWELGGVPAAHRTDRLTSAVNKLHSLEEFTRRYAALMRHYGLEPRPTNAASPEENGDCEQRHYRLKRAIEQELMLRMSRDFRDRVEYQAFLRQMFRRLNAGRLVRLNEELIALRNLPLQRLDAMKRILVRVTSGSTIRVNHNTYSVHSRLIREEVEVRLYSERLDVLYGGRAVDTIPRLRGEGGHYIQYRHIIDWLVRKPGAFENYRYREDLFPTHRFRMAYDQLTGHNAQQAASKTYLLILQLAARHGESPVDQALERLLASGAPVTVEAVQDDLAREASVEIRGSRVRDVHIAPVNLALYDSLLEEARDAQEVASV